MEFLAFLFFSLVWAFFGHLLWKFYSFLGRSLLRLLGGGKKPSALQASRAGEGADPRAGGDGAPEGVPDLTVPILEEADQWLRTFLRENGVRLLGLLGALIAAGAFLWIIDDLVGDSMLRRWIQFLSLLLLTAVVLFAGQRIRRTKGDLLGTGLMLVGFLLVPGDAAFYEQYILQHSTRSAYQVLFLMAVLAVFLCRRTGSRTFGWLSPACLTASVLMVGYRYRFTAELESYTASLLAPAMVALGAWLAVREWGRPFARSARLCGAAASVVGLIAFLDARPEDFVLLPLVVGLAGGATLAAVAYLETDLRGVVVVIPHLFAVFFRYLFHFGTGFGPMGVSCAVAGLGLLLLERRVRRGRHRRSGLDPRMAVPALFLFLAAAIVDGLTAAMMLGRLAEIRLPTPEALATVDGFMDGWLQLHRALFYAARLDPTLYWTALSGGLAALGLSLVGIGAGVPLYVHGGGIPLAMGFLSLTVRLRPPELHGPDYFIYLGFIVTLMTLVTAYLVRSPWKALARTPGFCAHLLAPPTWLALGVRVFDPRALEGWFIILTGCVLGVQLTMHGRVLGKNLRMGEIGMFLISLPWFLAIAAVPDCEIETTMVGLLLFGLGLNMIILWWGLSRDAMVDAAAGGLGLGLCLVAALARVAEGQVLAKVVVLVLGLALLWAGARTRRKSGNGGGKNGGGRAIAAVLLLGAVAGLSPQSALAAGGERITTRENLRTIARASPDDPLIQVVMRAVGVPVNRDHTTRVLWSRLQQNVGTLSGVESVSAALQLAAAPIRLRVLRQGDASIPLQRLEPATARDLDFEALARSLPGRPSLPESAGGPLADVPPEMLHLRFKSGDSLERILDLYATRGQAILSVTAPELVLAHPRTAFREASGVDPVSAASGCEEGALLVADPQLSVAADMVLVLHEASPEEARRKTERWAEVAGSERVHATGPLALLATAAGSLGRVRRTLEDPADPGLSGQPDYRYASLLDLPAPDGMLTISEAAVRHFISPLFRVLTHRRADCLAEQADIEASYVFARARGEALPRDPEAALNEARSRNWIAPGGRCRSGGTYLRGEGGDLQCSVHGSREGARVLDLRKASQVAIHPEERQAYNAFRLRYQSLYGAFVDPVAIGIDASPNRAVLESVIMPVARLPRYQTLLQWARRSGDGLGRDRSPLPLPPAARSSRAAAAVRLQGWTDLLQRNRSWGMYGPWREPAVWRLATATAHRALGPGAGLVLREGDLSALLSPEDVWKSGAVLPVSLFQEVHDQEAARTYLDELMAGSGHRKRDGYETFSVRVLGKAWLHAGLGPGRILMTTRYEDLADLFRQGDETGELPGGTAWMRVELKRLWEDWPAGAGATAGFLGRRCRVVQGSLQNLLDLGFSWPIQSERGLPRGEPFVDPRTPCPGGGAFSVEGGELSCSLHGTLANPRDALPRAGSPMDSLIKAMATLEVELAMRDSGIRTRLVVQGLTPGG